MRIGNYDRNFFWDTLHDAIFMHDDNDSYGNEVKACFIFTKIVSIGNLLSLLGGHGVSVKKIVACGV